MLFSLNYSPEMADLIRGMPVPTIIENYCQVDARKGLDQPALKVMLDLAGEPEIANSQIRRFLILHKELDADDGELTRTRKVRRGFIGEKYQSLLEALYSPQTTVHVSAQVRYEDGRTGTYSADLKIRDARTFPPAAAKRAA